MQTTALSRSGKAWEQQNADTVMLPIVQEKAARYAKDWIAADRPNPMMINEGSRLSRWLLRHLPVMAEVHLKDVAFVGTVRLNCQDIYLAVKGNGQLYFSFQGPENRMFSEAHAFSDFKSFIGEKSWVTFIRLTRELLDKSLQSGHTPQR